MKYTALTLILTYNCNLACDYCFCGRKRKEDMSEETAKKAIDYFAQNCADKADIVFFGGEPLLQADLIAKLCKYCDETYGKKFHYSMTTNGTLLNQKNIELIKNNEMSITISVDGQKESHDLHRHFYDGSPSFDLIMNNINSNNMNKNGITLRMTFTKHNVDKLADNLISLHKMGFPRLAFYPAADKDDMYTDKDIQVFQEQIDKLIDYNYACYQENRPIHIHWFDRSIKSHINLCGANCMAGIRQFSVTPDGEFYPCNRLDFNDKTLRIGNIETGIDKEKQAWIKAETFKKDPECEGCALKDRCSPCQIEAYQNTGKLWQVPDYYCMMNQYAIMKADQMAEKLYQEKNEHFMGKYYKDIECCEKV